MDLAELAAQEPPPFVPSTVCAHPGCGRAIEHDGFGYVHTDGRGRHQVDPGDDYRAQLAHRQSIVMARVALRNRTEGE
jgi:hypothetical protein